MPANAPQSDGAAALLKFLRSPKVIAVMPVDVVLAFTSPVKKADVERYVRFEPALSFKIGESSEQAAAFRLETRLAPRSRYRVTVDSAIRDVYGRPLEQRRYAELVTGDFVPVVSYPHGILTMPRSGEITLPLRHVNVRQVRVISVPIPDADRSRVLAVAPYLIQQQLNPSRPLHADTTLVTLAGNTTSSGSRSSAYRRAWSRRAWSHCESRSHDASPCRMVTRRNP